MTLQCKMRATTLLDKEGIASLEAKLCSDILKANERADSFILVGIQRRGADLARRLATRMEHELGAQIPLGMLDINLYRDDWTCLREGTPKIGTTSMPFGLDGKKIILVDDVLYTGRTIRAALEALLDYGRPASIELCVLIDRGHRELPIAANYIGQIASTKKTDHVDVLLQERDGREEVVLYEELRN